MAAVEPEPKPDPGPDAKEVERAPRARHAEGPAAGDPRAEDESLPKPETGPADDTIILLCTRTMVLFPSVVLPLGIGRKRSVIALQDAIRKRQQVGILLQKDPEVDDPGPNDLYRVGTTASILRYITAPDGTHHAICQGLARFRVLEFLGQEPYLTARIERLEEPETKTKEVEARFLSLKQLAKEALELLDQVPPELAALIRDDDSPSQLADIIATYMDLSTAEKQEVLETFDVRERLDKVTVKLGHRLEVLRLSREISQQTKGSMEKAQRDYFLREQMKTIQKELGEGDAKSVEMKELAEAIARANMPPDVEKEARKELARLERMPEAAAEYGMIRTYLDWLLELPWSVATEDMIDIARARAILDEDHYGLEKVKKRIIEYLAVRKLKPDGKGPILCLVGPPGVGKTSLGQSIARAMERKFVRVSLGGVHDEAEIRGHRRTYIGALPGNIIQGIRKAGARNPVFMLDELDKVSASFHGDPSAALLEVLDPEQNSTFRDNYLAVPFDLSKVLFIGTANVLDTIPGPLKDRCEVITIPGYTEDEKIEIARRYLLKRRLEATGLQPEECQISEAALRDLVRHYTREAGCRNLEREIGTICRHVATRIADLGSGGRSVERPVPHRIEVGDLHPILGPRKFENEVAMRTSVPGVATGMAWTPSGGEILFVEATRMPGKGSLILTGQLGEVMKESAQAAISLVKARARELGLDQSLFEKSDIHIHVPAGAIPKDGPSAGVALYTALVSLLIGRTVRSDVSMTGEISLRGLVLPVGGIKEKALAALSAGIQTVILPARNQKDYEEIPESTRAKLRFVWVERVEEAVAEALEPEAAAATERPALQGHRA